VEETSLRELWEQGRYRVPRAIKCPALLSQRTAHPLLFSRVGFMKKEMTLFA
jgi:hypothetical protein